MMDAGAVSAYLVGHGVVVVDDEHATVVCIGDSYLAGFHQVRIVGLVQIVSRSAGLPWVAV
jgi:hypothetical protein